MSFHDNGLRLDALAREAAKHEVELSVTQTFDGRWYAAIDSMDISERYVSKSYSDLADVVDLTEKWMYQRFNRRA